MMSEQAEIRGSGASPALVRLARALGLLARMPARPLRRSTLPSHRTRRRMLVGLLVLALTAPLGMTAPFDARAEEDEAETTDPTTVEHLEGAPFWQVLRQGEEGDDGQQLVRPWTKSPLNAVHFPSDEVGYAVGANGTVIRTADGGDTWKVSRLRRGDQIGDLHGVHFVDDNFGFAVGEGKNDAGSTTGVILGTSDGGESWWQVESGVSAALRDVHFPTSQVGYAAGDGLTILKTTDGGRSWVQPSVSDGTAPRTWHSVEFADASTGVFVGGRPTSGDGWRYAVTSDGGDSWEVDNSSNTGQNPMPIFDVALLGAGAAYAVGGTLSVQQTVLRTDNWFAATRPEPAVVAVGSLRGVTGYPAADLHPVVLILEAVESLLEEGPPQEVRDLVADVLHDAAEDIEDLEVPEPLQDGPVEEALEDLATSLKSLAETLRENEHWDEAKEEVDLLLEAALEALGEAEEMRGLVADVIDDAAEDIEELEVPEPADQPLDPLLQGLAGGLKDLAEAIRGQDVDGLEVQDELEGLRASARTVHAVGSQADLPVAFTRVLDAQLDTTEHSAEAGVPAWVAEPIEDWAAHQGKALHSVSASPGGKTVVAVGSGGLMLRRVATPQEAAESACLPRTDSAADEAPEEAICPEEEEPSDPEEQEPPLISPPLLTVSPEAARPGSAVTVKGENWVACEDPERTLGCQGVTVGLELRQGSKAFGLGQAESEDDGSFTLPVTVPEEAQAGSAIIHATGDPEPDGGPEAEAQFTVAAVTPVSITLNPAGAVPGGTFRVDGSGWHRCDGAGNCKGVTVDLEFRRDGKTFDLGQVEAADNGGFTLTGRQVPEEAKPGEAIVRAVGDPAPDGGPRAQAAFDVFGECLVSLTQINPEFPCLTAFNFELEPGQPAGDPSFLGFDPGLGESGRAVAVEGGGSSVRVFLYDVDRLEQRGVPGFGRHFPPESRSARGHETGVVFLADAGVSFPVAGAGSRARSVALDSKNHRLYLASGRAAANVAEMEILAISLIGEFPPASYVVQGGPTESITHLTVDGVNDMLYAATTSGQDTSLQTFATTTPQRDVQVRGIPVEVVGKGKNKKLVMGPGEAETGDGEPVCLEVDEEAGEEGEPVCLEVDEEAGVDEEEADGEVDSSWSIVVGDLCSTTAHDQLQFFGVSRDGYRLSLPCQGTDFAFVGFPQLNPNGILTLTLPPGESPRDLTEADSTRIVRHFQAVPGGGMGGLSHNRVQGDHASGLMTWRTGQDNFLVWDVDRGGWGGAATLGASLLAVDPASRRMYLTGSGIPAGHLFRMDLLNLPGSLEGEPIRVGEFLGSGGDRPVGAFDPRTRRMVVQGGSHLRVLEDREAPPISRVELHPDRRTTDIDEELASSVDRAGETAAYGARVWSTGLEGSLPGSYCVNAGGLLDISTSSCANAPPGLTYGDLQDRGLSNVRWQPYPNQRELFSARVEKAVLESSDSAVGISSGLSEGEAWGIDTDGRTGETAGTGEDIRSRRSTRDWHGRDEFAEFDECFEELYDRLLREVDGDRRVHHPEPCFEQFDQGDPHWNEDTGQNERPGLEQHAGLTQSSRCVDRGGEGGEVSTTGSRVVCDETGQSTVATADNALSTTLPGGISLDIDGSFSETNVFRDERGVVSEAVGVASGVRLEIAEVGRLEIGEVLTQATTWADGRPGGAGSKYTVAYKDVRVSAGFGPDGAPGDVVVFSCDPNEEKAVVAGDPVGQDDTGEAGTICDPEVLSDAVASVLGPRVTVQVPQRDRDEIAEGTPGGAQAIVRRHRNDFYNDRILFRMTRDELPGLTIEINADGTMANRMRIDLAAVYAESRYNIGDLAAPHAAPAFVEAPMADLRNTATVQVALTDPSGSPLEGGTFELAHEGGLAAGCSTNAAGECELTPLPLGAYDLFQTQAPPGYVAADPIGFELSQPGQVARITVVNGREGRDGSEVIEIIEILEDARPAVASDDAGGWWRRAARGLADVILRNPWVAVALALVISIVAAPGYLAARRRELSQMRELT